MCLCDKKRFRFTFKRIPIQKIVLKKAEENNTSYYSPYCYTSLYKKLGIYVLVRDLLIMWDIWITMDIGELKRLSFFSSAFWKTLCFIIKSDLNLVESLNSISPKLSRKEDCYIFEGGFFHAFTFKANTNSNYNALKRFKKYCLPQYPDGIKTAEAILVDGYIPAFTRYALGEDGDICARRMVLNI